MHGRRLASEPQVGLDGDDDEVDFLQLPAPVGALLRVLHHDPRH
jgi:hypothetical protein